MRDQEKYVEERLAELDPAIEVVALESAGPEALRLFIDHPDGVDLALCERVTAQLRELLVENSLEVSSPGIERPLTKPEHFRRFLGRRVRVRTRDDLDGRSNFTGTIAAADDEAVEVELVEGTAVTIPHERIRRSHLVPEVATQ